MDTVRIERRGAPAKRRPERVIADTAYDATRIRRWLRRHKIKATIKPNPSRTRKSGCPIGFDRAIYRGRNVVERLIGHLKEHRRIGTRSEKLAESYLAFVKLAFVERYLRFDSSNKL